jgi:hypothetical protein
MEYELRDFKLEAIRAIQDEPGDVHDSTTLLDPSEGEAPTTAKNDAGSEAYNLNASMSSRRSFRQYDSYVNRISFSKLGVNTRLIFTNVLPSRSHAKHRTHSLSVFIRPIIACSWQFIVLVLLIAFIIRTETTAYPIVPRHLATLYLKYPQNTTAAITLIGSLLSLISTKYVSSFQFKVDDR